MRQGNKKFCIPRQTLYRNPAFLIRPLSRHLLRRPFMGLSQHNRADYRLFCCHILFWCLTLLPSKVTPSVRRSVGDKGFIASSLGSISHFPASEVSTHRQHRDGFTLRRARRHCLLDRGERNSEKMRIRVSDILYTVSNTSNMRGKHSPPTTSASCTKDTSS